MKLYLNKQSGKVWEVGPKSKADLSGNSMLVQLNTEQSNFFLQSVSKNYTPSADEILNAERRVPEQPKPPTLAEHKAKKLAMLNKLSLDTAGILSPAHQRENANISLHVLDRYPNAETIYTKDEAHEVQNNANRVGKMCRQEFLRVSELIKSATTIKKVDTAFNSNQYNTFK